MALFGSSRDISVFRYINRELMGDIITQQAAYYKYILEKTKTNIYGEAAQNKYFNPPVLLNCLVERNDQSYPTNGFGVDLIWGANFAFLLDDLKIANVLPEIGDVIMYQEGYLKITVPANAPRIITITLDSDYSNGNTETNYITIEQL